MHHLHELEKKTSVPQHMRRSSLCLTRRATKVTATTTGEYRSLWSIEVSSPACRPNLSRITVWLTGQRCSQSTWLSPGQLQTTPIEIPRTEETSESGLCLPQQGRQQGRHHQEWIVHCPLKTPEQDHLLPKIPDIRCLQHCLQHSELHRVVSYDQHCMSSLVFLS